MKSPSDVSSLESLFARGQIDPQNVRAIVAKTEGNASATDYSALLAEWAFRRSLGEVLGLPDEEVDERVLLFIEGGAEGIISPHGTVLITSDSDSELVDSPSLAVGVARGAPFPPVEIGRLGQTVAVEGTVAQALENAELQDSKDVHCVLVLVPTLGPTELQALLESGQRLAASLPDLLAAASRKAAAIGVARVLNEFNQIKAVRTDETTDEEVTSSRAIVITNPHVEQPEVIVLGNSPYWVGPLVSSHAVMRDALDMGAIQTALGRLGFPSDRPLQASETKRLKACFAKTEADPSGRIRNRRHVMLEDADIHHTRHIRSVVGAVISAALGHTQVFVSSGAEGQGPRGGGPICLVAQVDKDVR